MSRRPRLVGTPADRQEALDAEAIVDDHADDTVAREGAPVIDRRVLAARHEAAAVDEQHDGTIAVDRLRA
jgi:hypothetical protein